VTRKAPRDLRLLVGAVGLSATGDLVALIALVLLVHDLTGSGLAVSALFAATMVPVVAFAPLAGLLADRVESVRLLALASVGQAVVAVGLAFTESLIPILGLSLLLGIGSAISQPAEFALVPAVAGEKKLTEANGWMETARYAGFTAGPLLAGVLAAAGGSRLALLVNAASFLAIAAAAGLMRVRRRPVPCTGEDCDRAREGFGFLWSDEVLRVMVGAGVLALLFISASLTVEVFYLKDVVGTSDAGYAAVIGSWTVGMVAGATALAPRVGGHGRAGAALVALVLQGAGMAAGATWAVLPVAMLGFLAGGLAHGVKNVLMRTVIHERTPERLYGRVFAAYNGLRNTAELGALGAGGILVTAIGAQEALILAGLGPVVAGLIGLAVLRRREVLRPAAAAAGT
jgi:Na+/melibiose symporter-like transporter